MKVLLSPAKLMTPSEPSFSFPNSEPIFLDKSLELVDVLSRWSVSDFQQNMKISKSISEKTYNDFKRLKSDDITFMFSAIFLYSGTAFKGLSAFDMNLEELNFAQDHLFILSGLYGLLKPLDLVQPYRLEMALKFNINQTTSSLYDFWVNHITSHIVKNCKNELLINLASNEYTKAVDVKKINNPVLTCHFLETKNGKEKVIASHAKMARGLMTRYIIRNKIQEKSGLQSFNISGYKFRDDLSTEKEYYFSR